MIHDSLRALIGRLRGFDRGAGTRFEAGFADGLAWAANRLEQILAEDAGGWRPVQISSGWSDGAGLMEPSTWIVVLCADGSIWRRFDCDMIWTRIPSPPPQEPQP